MNDDDDDDGEERKGNLDDPLLNLDQTPKHREEI